jgi:hypothetical protein
LSSPKAYAIKQADLDLDLTLNIADIQSYGDRIYVLDYDQGIVSFEYNPDTGVVPGTLHKIALLSWNIREAWGFLVKQSSAYTNIYVVDRTKLYHLTSIYGSLNGKTEIRYKYPLEDKLIGRPIIQSSGKYVAVQVKKNKIKYLFTNIKKNLFNPDLQHAHNLREGTDKLKQSIQKYCQGPGLQPVPGQLPLHLEETRCHLLSFGAATPLRDGLRRGWNQTSSYHSHLMEPVPEQKLDLYT